MYWGYMTLADDTEITFSETRWDGSVGVWVETPIMGGFKSAHCSIPNIEWDFIDGYGPEEMRWLSSYMRNNAPLIMEMSKEKAGAQLDGP